MGANTKTQTHSKCRLLLLVGVVISLLCIVLSIGKFISPPWELSITTENVLAEKLNDDFGIIVDKSGNRLCYLDGNGNVTDIKSSYSTENNLYFYSYADFNDKYVFVKEFCYFNDTHYIKQEKIVKYNHDGTRVADLVTYNYNLNDNYTNIPRTQSLSIDGNNLYYAYHDSIKNNYTINSVDIDTHEIAEKTEIKNLFPDPCANPNVFSIIYKSKDNSLTYTDSFGSKYYANAGDAQFSKLDTNIVDNYNLTKEDNVDDYSASIQTGEKIITGTTYNFSIILTLRILFFWASIAFFAISLIVLIVLYLRNSEPDEVFKKIRIPIYIVVSVGAVIGVIAYINEQNENIQGKSLDNQLTQCVMQISDEAQQKIKSIVNADPNSEQYGSVYKEVNLDLQESTLLSARSNISTNYVVHKYSNGQWQQIVNSSVPALSGVISNQFIPDRLDLDEYGIARGRTSNITGNYKFATTYIYNSENNIIGSVACFKNVDTARNVIETNTVLLMTAIISALITISFLLMEGAEWIRIHFNRKKALREIDGAIHESKADTTKTQSSIEAKKLNKYKPSKDFVKEFAATRPIYCLASAASSADSVIGVLIFQEMLIGTPFEGNLLIIALPMTLNVLGRLLGVFFAEPLIKKLGAKYALLLSATCSCLCFIGCAVFVSWSMIFVLSIALFASNMFKQCIWMYACDVPIHVKDKDRRKKLNNDCSASAISGAAIITIITGYLAENVGNWAVYICAAITLIVIFICVLILLPRRCAIDISYAKQKAEKQKSSAKDILKFVFRLDIMTMILSAFAICILISGYKSYIFPLLADMSGVSKSDVSNISVFASALAFYITPLFTSIQQRSGSKNTLTTCGLIVGIVFVIFTINSSFVWACLVYFIVQILSKFMWAGSSDFWQGVAIKSKSDSNAALVGTTTARNILDLAKNGAMGALMGIGSVFACVIIGIYSIVTSAIFAIVNKRE